MADSKEKKDKKKPSSPSLTRAIVIIAVLVVFEMVGAAMMIPSAEQTEVLARDLARASRGEDSFNRDEEEANKLLPVEKTKEVEIGAFNITRFNPETDAVLNVDFVVYGVVLEEDEELFLEEFMNNQSRIKEQIVLTMHSAETNDLSNAGLGLIKRRILEKTNRILGRPILHEIVFTKINFVER